MDYSHCARLLVSSHLMRWRTDYLRTLGAFFALAAALVFDGAPGFTIGHETSGMSAPPAFHVTTESAPVCKPIQAHFDAGSQARQSTNSSLMLRSVLLRGRAPDVVEAAQPYYNPLYRRPPPSLS